MPREQLFLELPQEVEVLIKPLELSGEEVLPRLRLYLGRIWPQN